MTLATELEQFKQGFLEKVPAEALEIMSADMERLATSGILKNSLKVGDKIPAIQLTDAQGELVSIQDKLTEGPVVLSFYRGAWCPYCNLQLNALQKSLPAIQEAGGSLVAISPQLPEHSATTAKTNELTFDVLSDVGNKTAREFGLVFQLGEAVRPLYQSFGIDIPKHNGDDAYELPVSATYVVNSDGVIVYAFVDLDYTQRAEPSEIIAHLKK